MFIYLAAVLLSWRHIRRLVRDWLEADSALLRQFCDEPATKQAISRRTVADASQKEQTSLKPGIQEFKRTANKMSKRVSNKLFWRLTPESE